VIGYAHSRVLVPFDAASTGFLAFGSYTTPLLARVISLDNDTRPFPRSRPLVNELHISSVNEARWMTLALTLTSKQRSVGMTSSRGVPV